MTHTYQLTGMTCSGCEATVKSNLLALPEVLNVEVSKERNTVSIQMSEHIKTSVLQTALGGTNSKYTIKEQPKMVNTSGISWLVTYKPLLLVFSFITVVSFLTSDGRLMVFMNHFMAGFFLVFSFFKLLDLNGFASSYMMYDIVAKRTKSYAYIYPFIELLLGIAFLMNTEPVATNVTTIVIMGISIIGVLQSVFNKQKIRCACLGAVFNLPMSFITILEDGIMIVMSATMLLML